MALTANRKRDAALSRVAKWARDAGQKAEAAAGGPDPDAILAELQKNILGRVVKPGDPDYDKDRKSQNPAVDSHPKVIVYAATQADVRWALSAARQLGWVVTSRSGGHSSAGYSVNNAFVLDTSELDGIMVDEAAMVARVGPGTMLGHLHQTLDAYDLAVPAGLCADVCVAGHMSGGGFGLLARHFGMNLDHVVQVKMALADGRFVVADRLQNPDLFWAARGGTGNQFGTLLEVTYRVERLGDVFGIAVTWPLSEAPGVLAFLQEHYMKRGSVADRRTGTPRFGHMPVLTWVQKADGSGTEQVLLIVGVYDGSRAEALAALEPLLAQGHPTIRKDVVDRYYRLNDSLLDILPGPNGFETKRGKLVAKKMTAPDWEKVVDYFAKSPNPYNIMVLEPYGGAVNAVPMGATAYIHRDCDFNVFIDSFYQDASGYDAAVKWMNDGLALFDPFWNEHMYQNYPFDPEPEFRWYYWGDAYPSLLFVKNKYDPNGVFAFPQGITPYPAGVKRSHAPSRFHDPHIVALPAPPPFP